MSKRDRMIFALQLHPELSQEFAPYDPVFQLAFKAAAAVIARGGTVDDARAAANAARAGVQ